MKTNRSNNSIRMFLLTAIAFCIGTFSSNSVLKAQQIHLRPQASVSSSIVRLGDVAQIVGGSLAEQSALQKLELFPLNPNKSSISVTEIRDELSVCGVDLLRWRLMGASQVAIRQTSIVNSVDQHSAFPNSLRRNSRSQNQLPKNTLRNTVQSQRNANTFGQSQSTTSSPMANQIPATLSIHPNQQFSNLAIRQATYNQQQGGAVRNNAADSEPVYAWTVRENKERGVVISEFDLEEVQLERSNQSIVLDPKKIIGKVVRNRLVAGQPIRDTNLEDLKYVERGKRVVIVSKIDLIVVSTTGRSLADATLGQEVTVESLDKSKKFIGTVTDFQTVTISSETSNDVVTASHNDPTSGYRMANQGRAVPTPVRTGSPAGRTAIRSDRLPGNSLR